MPQRFFQELANAATLDIFGAASKRRNKEGKYEVEESELGSIIDAVMFEGEYEGKSPLAYFVAHASLSSDERQLYENWLANTRYAIFEIQEVVIGKYIKTRDIFYKESLIIYEKLATYDLQPGMAVTGRIVPFADAWMFTGGTNIRLTPEMLYSFKRSMPHLLKPGVLRQLDIIKFFQVAENPLDDVSDAAEDEGCEQYDDAVVLMQEGYFLEALELFTQLYPQHLKEHGEPFRWWLNVGSCLANLGEEKLAKLYYKKSLQLNPNYKTAKANLAAMETHKKQLLYYHGIGRQQLLSATLARGVTFSMKGIEKNSLVHDAIAFLTFLDKHPVLPTDSHRNIPLAVIKQLNQQLSTSDPETTTVTFGGKTMTDTYTEEAQFPKVTFLHSLFLQNKLIQDNKKQLIVKQAGYEFLRLSPAEQLSKLLSLWLVESDWVQLERPKKRSTTDFGVIYKDAIEATQNTTWNMLNNLMIYEKRDITYDMLIENVFPEMPHDEAFRFMSGLVLDRVFLQHLIWADIIISKGSLAKGHLDFSNGLPTIFPIQITPFGLSVIQTITKAMQHVIPEMVYEIIKN